MTHAQQLHTFLKDDPQFQLPRYPNVSEAFQTVWHHGELALILGGTADVVLRGKAVRRLLPQLLPLLNGTNDFAGICERLPGYTPNVIQDALMLLYMQGVLEEGQQSPGSLSEDQLRAFSSQLLFYSRYVDLTRVHANRYSVLEQLQTTSVFLIGSEILVKPLQINLAQLGLGATTWQPWQTPTVQFNDRWSTTTVLEPVTETREIVAAAQAWLQDHPQGLIILLTEDAHTELTKSLNQLVVNKDGRFLRAVLNEQQSVLGPTVFGPESSCYECAQLQGLFEVATDQAQDPVGVELGIYQLTSLILAILTNLVPIYSADTQLVFNQATLTWEPRAVHKLVGCPTCGIAYNEQRNFSLGSEYSENFPAWYHMNTNERSYAVYPKGHQQHYSKQNAKAMSSAAKGYTNSPTWDLQIYVKELPATVRRPFGHTQKGLTPPSQLEQLSWLFLASAGRQIQDPVSGWQSGQRVTPAGGNLASQTLYFINTGIRELPLGLYHFNQQTGQLELRQYGDLRAEIDACIGTLNHDTERIPGIIVETIALGRLEAKYGYKAYRYGLYDGGAMLETLSHASSVVGWDLHISVDFDDHRLQALLNLQTAHNEVPLYLGYLQTMSQEG